MSKKDRQREHEARFRLTLEAIAKLSKQVGALSERVEVLIARPTEDFRTYTHEATRDPYTAVKLVPRSSGFSEYENATGEKL